jgi:hypothetical protein
MDSLKATEAASAAVAVAPRVKLEDIENAINARFEMTAREAVDKAEMIGRGALQLGIDPRPNALDLLSICILVMSNGFTVIGHSAPASPENFNAELGKKLAYENAIRQLWPLMGFSLRDRLAAL